MNPGAAALAYAIIMTCFLFLGLWHTGRLVTTDDARQRWPALFRYPWICAPLLLLVVVGIALLWPLFPLLVALAGNEDE